MHLASTALRRFTLLTVACALSCALSGVALADRVPLVGPGDPIVNGVITIVSGNGQIVPLDTLEVPCPQLVDFDDLDGGPNPGTSYDGLIAWGGILFAERFSGQLLGYSGEFDVVTGSPSNPLLPQIGAAGANLNVFDYDGHVLNGLGPLLFPDIDAIGEGAIAMQFPVPQSKVRFDLVGGNGGSATLGFYRANGSLIDQVAISGLADLSYGFGTAEGSSTIAGILIQNTDAAGIGVVNICYDSGVTTARAATWGRLKALYR
jgi:hypothetical protein